MPPLLLRVLVMQRHKVRLLWMCSRGSGSSGRQLRREDQQPLCTRRLTLRRVVQMVLQLCAGLRRCWLTLAVVLQVRVVLLRCFWALVCGLNRVVACCGLLLCWLQGLALHSAKFQVLASCCSCTPAALFADNNCCSRCCCLDVHRC